MGRKYGKMGEKHTLWEFFGDRYRYTLNMLRSGHFGPTCTGTSQRCTGTCKALFSNFDQFSYFDHNLLISDPIRVIQVVG